MIVPVPAVPSPADLLARLTDTAPAAILRTVCAWHTSPLELVALSRQYPGQLSHGICAACLARMEQEIA
jgi:hypothetical protein